ncbi:TonB-dependent receptor [Paucibacter sp. APW11]|uniref:TonB-dependent receptor n=1 Tax=Roseateles aquae TaxID=3077235 RepID=A0ABU3PCB7_9BURK|nr:TonB-dependent receptor [Paucibacter sp. APW11]MDT9000205.1 TonB-dependent receptor [Paucibacter sp. APW11]
MTSLSRRCLRLSTPASLSSAPQHTLAQAALAALLLSGTSAMAQASLPGPGANKLGQVVVTASRSPLRLSEVLNDLTVLNRAEIERQAFGSLGDLLRNAGCVEMVRNGTPASNTSLFLRGAETRHTVLLIDGVRVDSQASSGASWQAIPLSQIERIEVLKGPASAIYGSDAIGGVVQVFTRKGNGKPSLEIGSAIGNLGLRKIDGSLSGVHGIFDYALTAASERADGFNGTVDYPGSFGFVPDRDGWRNHNAGLRFGVQFAKEHRAELMVSKSRIDGQYDANKDAPLNDDHSIQDTRAAQLSLSSQWSAVLQTQLSLNESHEDYETKPSPYLSKTRVRNLALNGSYEITKGQQLNFIVERREDWLENSSLTQTATAGVDKRHQNAAALGWLWNEGALSVQAHGRHDQDSQFGGVNTGTLALGYEIERGLRIVGSAGNAFRAPSLYQRGSQYGPNLSKPGVIALDAERGRNLEFGLKYSTALSDFSLTAYRNMVKQLIVFGAAGSCNSAYGCYRNVAEARLQGVSLAASTTLGPVQLSGTLDLQAPKDLSNGKLLARRAKHFGTLHASTVLAGWDLGAGLQFSGKRFDTAANTRELGGYALVNFDAQYKLSKELKLQLNLDNAFNREYQTAYGYAQAPRTILIGLRYTPSL